MGFKAICLVGLILEKLSKAIFDEIVAGLGASLLRGYVGEGEVGSDGEEGGAGDEAADGGGQLLGRWWVRPQDHVLLGGGYE